MAAKKLKAMPRDAKGRIVLAEGEVTGHAHVITDEGAVLLGDGEALNVLQLEHKVALTHEEHGTLGIDPTPDGWEVRIQREYSIFGERRVLD